MHQNGPATGASSGIDIDEKLTDLVLVLRMLVGSLVSSVDLVDWFRRHADSEKLRVLPGRCSLGYVFLSVPEDSIRCRQSSLAARNCSRSCC
jgi:hypothetical protein